MDSFAYGGCCSHSSLNDRIRGNFSLTPEQIKAVVAEIEAREKAARKVANAKQYKRMREVDLEGFKARKREHGATYRVNSADKKHDNEMRFRAKAKEEKRFYCETCGVTCTNNFELQRHNDSKRHKLAVKRKANGKLRFHCTLCDKHFTHQCHLDRHRRGQRHLEKAAKAAAEASK